jgi:hypothetical protein
MESSPESFRNAAFRQNDRDPASAYCHEPPEPAHATYFSTGLVIGIGVGLIAAVLLFKTVSGPVIVPVKELATESVPLGYDG